MNKPDPKELTRDSRNGGRPAHRDVCRSCGPDPSCDSHSPRRRGGDGERARRAVPDHRSGGVEAPQGARAGGADHTRALGSAAAFAPARRPARRGCRVAREVPSLLAGAPRSPRPALAGTGEEEAALSGPRSEEDAFRVGFTLTRVFDAPRERVWREWTEPEAFADWFGAPGGEVPLSTVSMDVRPGGSLRLTMFAGPERREINWTGVYREVRAPERLVFTISDQPDDERYELIVVVLTDLGDGRTEMLLEQRGLMPPEEYERAGAGWSTFFDRIDERLAHS